jgi:hypothetical protein
MRGSGWTDTIMLYQEGAGISTLPTNQRERSPTTVKIHWRSATKREEGKDMEVKQIFNATWMPIDASAYPNAAESCWTRVGVGSAALMLVVLLMDPFLLVFFVVSMDADFIRSGA